MRITKLFPALLSIAFLAMIAASALAQVGRIEGDVKKADTNEPIADAVVDIVRTDIKGNYTVKTDKKGHYLHAGVPFVGTYTILVSAPGYAPTFLPGVRPDREPANFKLLPGDGRKLTIEEAQKSAPAASAGGGGAAGAKTAADNKKAQEEIDKKNKEIMAHNEKIKADFEKMKGLFESGQTKFKASDWAGAVSDFKEAIALDPEQHVVHYNLSLALYNQGVTQLNDSVKGNDPSKKEAAKMSFTDSVASANKAIAGLDASAAAEPAKAGTPEMKQNKIGYLKVRADASSLLGKRFFDVAMAEASNKDYNDMAAMIDDPAKKKEYIFKGAETLREAGKGDLAIAAYKKLLEMDPNNADALYGLGVAYASQESTFQDAADMLQAFVDKAPNDPRANDAKLVIDALRVGNNIKPSKVAPASRSNTRKKG